MLHRRLSATVQHIADLGTRRQTVVSLILNIPVVVSCNVIKSKELHVQVSSLIVNTSVDYKFSVIK